MENDELEEVVKLEEKTEEFEDVDEGPMPPLLTVAGPKNKSLSDRPPCPMPLLLGTLPLLLCMWLISVLLLLGCDEGM